MNLEYTYSGTTPASSLVLDRQSRGYLPYLKLGPTESDLDLKTGQADITQSVLTSSTPARVVPSPHQVMPASPQSLSDQRLVLAKDLAESQQTGVSTALRKLTKHHHLFTDRTMNLVTILWHIVLSQALQAGLTVSGYIDAEEDSEEQASQVVLRVYVEASAVQTLAFWDGLDDDLGRWLDRLPPTNRDVAMHKIGLRLHWAQ